MSSPVVLITGASSGIGQYLANSYYLGGFNVVGCGRSDIRDTMFDYVGADITNKAELDFLFSFIKRKYGKLDILINNAGTASMNAFLLTPIETIKDIFNLNFIALADVTQRASRLMIPNKYGRIVNITSVARPLELEGESIYAASKAAVESLTRVLSKELASFGITVNAVGPTPVETNLLRGVSKDKLEVLMDKQAIKKKATLEDIKNAIDIFIYKDSSMITGQIIYLGGA